MAYREDFQNLTPRTVWKHKNNSSYEGIFALVLPNYQLLSVEI